jgi:hypothetical protein
MNQNRDEIEDIFNVTGDFVGDNPEDVIETPPLVIDLDEVNNEARSMAILITERLSNYYFDEKYLENHPYVPTKIMTEMENIRRLLKMLAVNEKAQDSLIANITFNAGKGSLYSNLTSLQNSMLNIQSQLNTLTTSLENIFKEMQEECDKTFQEKEKEDTGNGIAGVRGSREFIKMLQNRLINSKSTDNNSNQESNIT